MEREEPEAWSGNGGSEEQGNEESQALNVSDVGKHTHTTHTPTVYYSVHEELLSRALELLSSALLQKWLGMKPAGCKVWESVGTHARLLVCQTNHGLSSVKKTQLCIAWTEASMFFAVSITRFSEYDLFDAASG